MPAEWFDLDCSDHAFHECEDPNVFAPSDGNDCEGETLADTDGALWQPRWRHSPRWTNLADDEDMGADGSDGASSDTSGPIEKTTQVAGYAERPAQSGISKLLFDAWRAAK